VREVTGDFRTVPNGLFRNAHHTYRAMILLLLFLQKQSLVNCPFRHHYLFFFCLASHFLYESSQAVPSCGCAVSNRIISRCCSAWSLSMRASTGSSSFSYIFAQALTGIVEVVVSNSKISGVTLDLGVDSLHSVANQTPETRRTRAALAFEKRQNVRPQLPSPTCLMMMMSFICSCRNKKEEPSSISDTGVAGKMQEILGMHIRRMCMPLHVAAATCSLRSPSSDRPSSSRPGLSSVFITAVCVCVCVQYRACLLLQFADYQLSLSTCRVLGG
jgi:hypothetical protein